MENQHLPRKPEGWRQNEKNSKDFEHIYCQLAGVPRAILHFEKRLLNVLLRHLVQRPHQVGGTR
jgi:hypothetical protein